MRSVFPRSLALVAAAALFTACSDQAPVTAPDVDAPLFAPGPGPQTAPVQLTLNTDATWEYCGMVAPPGYETRTPCVGVNPTSVLVAPLNPGWGAPLGASLWMHQQADAAGYTVLPGAYTWEKEFTIPAGTVDQELNVTIRADNSAEVFLNGVSIGKHATLTAYSNFNSTLNLHELGLAPGVHTIAILLNNTMDDPDFPGGSSGNPNTCEHFPNIDNAPDGWTYEECRNPSAVSMVATVRWNLAPPPVGDQGCSHGFWKNKGQKSHKGAPTPFSQTGYTTGQLLGSVFTFAGTGYTSKASRTFDQALNDGGGGITNLMRQAVAGLLNAGHPGVDYPLSEAEIIDQVNAAMLAGNGAVGALAEQLDEYNNLHGAGICPD